jgi:hypothetical protein
MVTQFVLRTDKKDSAGRCPVHLVVYFDGARLKCATGEKCKPADRNADKQQFRRSYPLADDANDLLKRMAGNVLAWWRKLRAVGEAPALAGLRAVLRPASVVPEVVATPVSVALRYEEYRGALRAWGYAKESLRQHIITRNWFAGFERYGRMVPDPVTYDLEMHDRLLIYLRVVRKLAPNSLYTAIKKLKACASYGMSGAWRQALSCGNWWRSPPTRRSYTCRQRLVQSKKRAGVSIYLTAASAILNKYADPERLRLLPVHPNQVMNKYLKWVAQLADLVSTGDGGIVRAAVPKCELVTMHTARHTFATQSLLGGMPVKVLQKMLGHKKIRTTLNPYLHQDWGGFNPRNVVVAVTRPRDGKVLHAVKLVVTCPTTAVQQNEGNGSLSR